MNQIVSFQGRGGDGGGGGASSAAPAVRTPDNLRSLDSFEMIIGLCEGPIAGLEDGGKSFYVGDTTLLDVNGHENFTDFSLKIYVGDEVPNYEIVPNLGGLASSKTVGTVLDSGVELVRQTQVGDIDFIEVRSVIQQLYQQTDSGVYTSSLEFRVEVRPTGATKWCSYAKAAATVAAVRAAATLTAMKRATSDTYLFDATSVATKWDLHADNTDTITISGKTTSNYAKELRIPVVPSTGTWDVRMLKVSPNSDTTTFRVIHWESYQEIVAGGPYKWPNTAVAHILGRASNQFNSMPDFAGIYKGMIVRVPTNYDPEAKTYDGIWDGTFKMAWTDNGPWCVYDIVTNDRYGMSTYLPVTMDKWSVYEAARWCDERLSDGACRYTFNALIAEHRGIKDQVRFMAGSFNSIFFTDLNGTAYLKVDKDEQAIMVFAEENTVEGFSYSFTDITSRYNDITVTFINPAMNWQDDRRRVFDQAAMDKHGRITHDFVAVGCIHEREAIRRAKYKLITSNTEVMMCSFRTNRQAQFLAPFDVILIADPDLGYGLSGRIKSYSGRTITLRDPLYLEAGITYGLKIDVPNGVIDVPIINPISGYNYTLTVPWDVPAFVPEKATFALYQEGAGYGVPKPFRVLKITEGEHADDFEVSCIEINRNKWYEADNLTDLDAIEYSFLADPRVVPGPSVVNFYETFNKRTREFTLGIEPELNRSAYKYYSGDFEVWSRLSGQGSYQKVALTHDNTVINHPPGLHEFKILAKSTVGSTTQISQATAFTYNVTNPKNPPADVAVLRGTVTSFGISLDWDAVTDIDTDTYELRMGADPETAPVLDVLTALRFETGVKLAGDHTFWIRAVDFLGNPSVNWTSTVVSVAPPVGPNVTASLVGPNAALVWNYPTSAFAIDFFEVFQGEDFETAEYLSNTKASTLITEVNWAGSLRFWVRAVDVAGNRGAPGSTDVVISPANAVSVSSQVIDNNVLLRWNEAVGQLPIASYEVRRGATFATATSIGTKTGTFTTIFEEQSGTFTYWIAAIDTAGNIGSPASITTSVAQPPDYVLFQTWVSEFSGTLTNAMADGGVLTGPINTTETVAQHFDDNTWGTPQDQITAGFPIYIQPSNLNGQYVEVFDYGGVVPSTKVTLDTTKATVAGTVTLDTMISLSLDGTTWTDYPSAVQVFAANFRYVKVTLDFSSADNTGVMNVTSLVVRLDVKQKNDAGNGTAVATDVGGTTISFNTNFIDVASITVTPLGTTPMMGIYDFVDAPNPTDFKVLIFDKDGNRVTTSFSWSAKGV